jgi:hypothetical protein
LPRVNRGRVIAASPGGRCPRNPDRRGRAARRGRRAGMIRRTQAMKWARRHGYNSVNRVRKRRASADAGLDLARRFR